MKQMVERMRSLRVNNKIKSFVLEAFAFSVAIGLVATFVYFVFLRDRIIDEEKRGAANFAFNLYIENASDTDFSNALSAYKECITRLHYGDCDYPRESDLVSIMISNGHIDQVINDFELRGELGLDGGINSQLMVDYSGKEVTGLFMKADALVGSNQVSLAIPIYRSLFDRNEKVDVAIRLRGLLSYYGCTSDYEVWGELTERQTIEINPHGAPYPKQPQSLSAQEIVDLRIRLSRGEFVPFTTDCPINKLSP
jgi:hypothetical protein